MKILLAFIFAMLLVSCQQADNVSKEKINELTLALQESKAELKNASEDETGFIHTVFFWLNEGVEEKEKSDFVKNGLSKLLKVSSIYKGYVGPPALKTRDVVDNSYDFALVCHFKNAQDEEMYQNDPDHLKFIDDYKHLWKKVVVYDNLVAQE